MEIVDLLRVLVSANFDTIQLRARLGVAQTEEVTRRSKTRSPVDGRRPRAVRHFSLTF